MPPGEKLAQAEDETRALPGAGALLAAAVAGIGGAERPGQVAMAEAVERCFASGEHLAVQAGTGTGKSLAYLVPAAAHAMSSGAAVVVATATIALQRQLIDRDLPRLSATLAPLLGREPVFAILKGRRNYLCLHRLRSGAPEDPADMLFEPSAVSAVGKQVQRLAEWADSTTTGDRDELVPGVEDPAWRQVSVPAPECMGAQRCPFGTQCFAERAREAAGKADIVVTNHALLAIDALEDYPVLPEHDVVIIDEAHDLVNRVTTQAAADLSAVAPETAARRCGRLVSADAVGRLRTAGEAITRVFPDVREGRIDVLDESLAIALAALRDAASGCAAEVRASAKESGDDADRLAGVRAALAALDDLNRTAERILASFGPDIPARREVAWMDRPPVADPRRPATLRVAPLEVGGLLAERLFRRRRVVLTSATLALGGSFQPLARQWGLPAHGLADAGPAEPGAPGADEAGTPGADEAGAREAGKQLSLAWSGLDVGSPFEHPRRGILYVARHLPPPGRDGLPASYLTELRELITAAGGRTLGLFSSMRAARQAAAELRAELDQPLLCQGDDATAQLVRQFAEDEATCLFGTLSLWQGVDVPGPSLQLVVIDRIPFPRPDDPLASARQRVVAAHGGNGFMAVAVSHAALLLAQGAGRLLRTMDDRGMVAILDPRLATARYGGFLRASLPPFWATTDPAVARDALRRLAAQRS
ncbi:MAG TPA: ATP-dependent DNA helicase [Streptosporangiaceae bacterium]|nr:ATP-dependent DNA helicase [Streptosporangiaceae bacterium]